MKQIRIAIDDGHGMETAGKETPALPDGSRMKENQFNAAVAAYLGEALLRCGFAVVMVAPEDTDIPLKTRVQRAHDYRADCYISIHANAYGTGWNDANGIESWIYEKVQGNSDTWQFAKCIHNALVAATGRRNRGIKRSDGLYVLSATKMHAVLVECGFMTNRAEAALLQTEAYRRCCAEAIAKGFCQFYGREYIAMDERYQRIEDVPAWGQAVIKKLIQAGCFADADKLGLSYDMVRTLVILDRYERSRRI